MSVVWSDESTDKSRASKAVCSSGTEADSELDATAGMPLDGPLENFTVRVESTTGSAFTAGTLDAYMRNPISGRWSRFRSLDRSVGTVTGDSYEDLELRARPGSHLAYLPNGLGQACEVFVAGDFPRRF